MIKPDKYYKRCFHPLTYGVVLDGKDNNLYHYFQGTWNTTGFNKRLVIEATRDFEEISEDAFNKLQLAKKLLR